MKSWPSSYLCICLANYYTNLTVIGLDRIFYAKITLLCKTQVAIARLNSIQSHEGSTIVNDDSIIVPELKIPHIKDSRAVIYDGRASIRLTTGLYPVTRCHLRQSLLCSCVLLIFAFIPN